MSQSTTVGNQDHSLDNKTTITEEATKAPLPPPSKLQSFTQPKAQKARKTFPSSSFAEKQQHELNLAETLSLNLSRKEVEHTRIIEKSTAPCAELDPAVSKQKLLNLMRNEFDTPG